MLTYQRYPFPASLSAGSEQLGDALEIDVEHYYRLRLSMYDYRAEDPKLCNFRFVEQVAEHADKHIRQSDVCRQSIRWRHALYFCRNHCPSELLSEFGNTHINLLQVYRLTSCGSNKLTKSPSLSHQTVTTNLDPTLKPQLLRMNKL